MSAIYWTHTSKSYPRKFDVIIIGAGYLGLSTAYWLKKHNSELKVAIVEKDTIGNGASSRNAGFLTKGSLLFYSHLTENWGAEKASLLYEYAQNSINLLSAEFDLVCDSIAAPTAAWTFIRSDEALARVSKIPKSILNDYTDVHLDEAPLRHVTSMKKVFSGSGEFTIHPTRLLSLLEKKVKDLGVDFILGAQVLKVNTGLHPEIETSFGNFSCEKLMVCTNGESYLLPELKLDIVPQRAQMLAMKLASPIYASGLFYDPEARVYFKFDRPGYLLIGGKRLVDEANENTTSTNVSPKIQEALYEYVRDELNYSGEKINTWAGTMGFTKNELPYVGKISNLESCYVAAGFSGHGMGWGFKTAQEMALLLLGKINEPQLVQMTK